MRTTRRRARAGKRVGLVALLVVTMVAALVGSDGVAPAPARVAAKKQKCKQKCQKQVQQCDDDEVQQFCSRFIAERKERCRQNFLPCCGALGSCNAAGSTECFLDRTIFVCHP